ncbi:MAG: hypothetical protein HOV92_00670 [Streptomyces sp.]|nr:hypothetical protein [Streptomyces sp.]
MSLVTVTFAAPSQLPPLTLGAGEVVTDQVVRYLQRELPEADAAQYDAIAGLGVAFAGSDRVARFTVAPLGGAA